MRVIELQQNSEEWLEFRKGKSGGSEFSELYPKKKPLKTEVMKALDEAGVKYQKSETLEELIAALEPRELARLKLRMDVKSWYYKKLAEKVARDLTPNDYADKLPNVSQMSKSEFMMARGHILEEEAREAASEKIGVEFEGGSEVWVREDNNNIYISPDGWHKEKDGKIKQALEIKCLESEKVLEAYLTGKYPEDYYPQICKYFIVNENLEDLYFVIYTDLIPGLELQVWRIKRDDVESDLEVMRIYEDEILKRLAEDEEKIIKLGF